MLDEIKINFGKALLAGCLVPRVVRAAFGSISHENGLILSYGSSLTRTTEQNTDICFTATNAFRSF